MAKQHIIIAKKDSKILKSLDINFENNIKIIEVIKNIIADPSYDLTTFNILYLCGFFIFPPVNDDKRSETANITKEQATLYLCSQKSEAIIMNPNGKNKVPSVFLFKL